MRILLDFETFSPVPITVGPNRQLAEPGAGAWCVAWGTSVEKGVWSGPILTVLNGGYAGIPAVEAELERLGYRTGTRGEFLAAFDAATVRVAHNAPYERAVMRWIMGFDTLADTWSCTLARSTRLGLPPALEDVLRVLNAPVEKDLTGNTLSRKMAKHRGVHTSGSGARQYLWHDDFASVVRVTTYCGTDFMGEAWLDDVLPELEPVEHGRWVRQTLENERGIAVDWDLVHKGLAAVAMTAEMVNANLAGWTSGALTSISKTGEIVKWAARRGVQVTSLEAETLDLLLDSTPDLPDDVRDVLEARRSVRTSTMKLQALVARRMPASCGAVADRVLDLTQYGGARTLRTVGRGFQPLNLPRAGDVDVKAGLAALRNLDVAGMCAAVSKDAKNRAPSDKAGVRTYRGPASSVMPSEVVAACLRATLVPSRGKKFVAVDYSGVESRATFTLAGQDDVVEAIRNGADTYCELASEVYGHTVTKKEHPDERQMGKQGILGCGFGLSRAETFIDTCAKYGLYIGVNLSQKIIDAFSRKYNKVPILWRGLHNSVKDAFNYPNTWQGKPEYGVYYQYLPVGLAGIPWLQCWLPSGRMMYYPGARMLQGEYGPTPSVMSQKQGQWVRQFLTRQVTVENVVQAICRDMMEEDKERILASGRCEIVLTIYDEIVAEFSEAETENLVEFNGHLVPEPQAFMETEMSSTVSWFPKMPRGTEGWVGGEFRK